MQRVRVWLVALCLVAACRAAQPKVGESAGTPAASSSKPFSFSILEDYDKGDDLADVRRDFAAFRDLGITTWRGSLGWDDYEPQRGTFDFDWLHRFAEAAEQDGITLRPYIGYTPAWASAGGTDSDVWNDPPAKLDDWARFVRELARALRQHPNVRSLEIYNEENVPQWWDGTARQYRQVAERAAREIRAANPNLQVLLGGMVFPDVDWLEQVCGGASPPVFDIVPFHAYPETWTPPEVDLERYLGPAFEQQFVPASDEQCGRRPIWINETGFATVEHATEAMQAAWWARAIALFAATPRVEHVGVYEIKDLTPESAAIGGTANYHLGLLHADRTKKRAFDTVRMFAAWFGAGGFTVQPPGVRVLDGSASGAEIFSYGFRLQDHRQVLVVWAKRGTARVDMAPASRAGSARERTLTGDVMGAPFFDGTALRNVTVNDGQVRVFELSP